MSRRCLFLATFVVIAHLHPANADITTGLIARYPFDGNANDIGGNNSTPAPTTPSNPSTKSRRSARRARTSRVNVRCCVRVELTELGNDMRPFRIHRRCVRLKKPCAVERSCLAPPARNVMASSLSAA